MRVIEVYAILRHDKVRTASLVRGITDVCQWLLNISNYPSLFVYLVVKMLFVFLLQVWDILGYFHLGRMVASARYVSWRYIDLKCLLATEIAAL